MVVDLHRLMPFKSRLNVCLEDTLWFGRELLPRGRNYRPRAHGEHHSFMIYEPSSLPFLS